VSAIRVDKLTFPGGEPHSPLWTIGSDYFSANLVAAAKAVPGMRFEKQIAGRSNVWLGYPDAVCAVVARLKELGVQVEWDSEPPTPDSWRTSRTPYLFSAKGLREYQVEGVRFLLTRARDGALLADAMRLGKSLQATIAARAWKEKTLVVCPSHVVGVWSRPKDAIEGPGEIAKWWPDAWKGRDGQDQGLDGAGVTCLEGIKPWAASQIVRKLSGEKNSPDDDRKLKAARSEIVARAEALQACNVIVCHYDVLYAWADVLITWGVSTLILDEVHILATHTSRRMEEIKRVRGHATRVIGLSGTPLSNNVRKLFNVLDLLCPGRMGYFFTPNAPEKASYARVFCDSHQEVVGKGESQLTIWRHDGKSNLDKPDGKWAVTPEETLHARLQHFTLRRLKRDVDPQLPEKTRQIVDVAVPARCMIGVGQHTLAGKGEELRRALNLAADGKLKPVVALVADHIAEGEKVICYCYRRLFAEEVAKEVRKKVGKEPLIEFVHGEQSAKERDRRANALRTFKGPGVLVCTIDSYSTGVDLSFSNVIVVAELTWEPHELAQLEERIYKFDSGTKALVQYVIARGTGDELILRAVINKLDTFEKVIGPTGDRMKEDLSEKEQKRGLDRLYEALVAMQAASPVPAKKTRKQK
jgi:SNF2 family DNA or RNA helicase